MAALDFPSSPSVGQIYTPAGGAPTYIWSGTAWSQVGQAGVFKVSSGLAPTILDVALPSGFSAFDLLLQQLGTAANGELCMRLSADGTTFPAAAGSYTYAVNQTAHNATNTATGSAGNDRIIMVPLLLNSATIQSSWKIHIPVNANAYTQEVFFDGVMHSGAAFYRVAGAGAMNGALAAGSPKAVRLFMNGASAALTPTTAWQLMGYK